MIKWLKEHKAITVAGSFMGGSALFIFAWLLGRKYGANQIIEELIHICEYGEKDWPVYTSSDENLGGLMYELSAECIGD